jgi:hypothetical protein
MQVSDERRREIPSTGFGGFDAYLEDLYQLDTDEVEKKVAAGVSVAELVNELGAGPFRVATAVENRVWIRLLTRANPKQLVPFMEETKDLTRRLFGPILDDQAKRAELEIALDDTETVEKPAFPEAFNVVSRISFASAWELGRGSVTPRLRVVFRSWEDRMLLDSTLDWDDIIYVAYRLVDALRDNTANLELVAPKVRENLDLKGDLGDRTAKRINLMIEDLREIRAKLIELGFSKEDFGLE